MYSVIRKFFRPRFKVQHGNGPSATRRVIECAVAASLCILMAASPVPAADKPEEVRERAIFVPFDDLSVILGGPNERVFMARDAYRQLEAEAKKLPPAKAPQPVVLLNASYEASIRGSLAVIRGRIDMEVLDPGLFQVPLQLDGVALRSALLDNRAAPIARLANGQVVLFVRNAGRHQLEFELHTAVIVAAAQQSLQFKLPNAAGSTLTLTVPGNVDVKAGVKVVERVYDQDQDKTRFELVFVDGSVAMVLSLNNRRLRQDRVVVARSVLVSELTTSYERLHATVHMNVLHGAVDRFLFEVPDDFQITSVESPLVSQWVLRQEGDQEVLEVLLREPTRDTETLSIAATRAPVKIERWTMPRLQPRDVAGHVGVIGLLTESRLRPLGLSAENLIHIDTTVLRDALPASVLKAEPGAPEIRPVAAYYAPGDEFQLTASLDAPEDELRAATHLLLSLDEERQSLRGGFTLTPEATKQTAFSFRMPDAWQLQKLHGSDQKPLTYDRYRSDGETRYVVKLPTAIEPGKSRTIYFEATYSSSSWLGDWTSSEVEFPRVRVEQATASTGAIAVQPRGDLTAKPIRTDGLAPLDSSQRSRFGLGESSTELTYRVTKDDYSARFRLERTQPRISTRNYSLFQVRDGVLMAHYELVYIIERAHTKKLVLELPDSTPTALSIRGLDNVQLKEYSHVTEDGKNVWTILLAQARSGTVRLAIEFEQRLSDPEPKSYALPIIRAANVAYQTHMVSIEGDPALDIDIDTSMRQVDVGELAEADYSPGRRLLGAFASTADDSSLQIDVARRALRPLPAAIVKRAQLVTLVSSTGVSQSAARYVLRTKVPFLAIRFPEDYELWSATLNGRPIKPRRRDDQILLSLQTDGTGERRDLDLQVVYQAPVASVTWVGEIETSAPQLLLMADDQDLGIPVPQVDLEWHVHLPTGYRVSRVHGTVYSDDVERPESPLKALADAAVTVGGGIHGPPIPMSSFRAVRQMAVLSARPQTTADQADGAVAAPGDDAGGVEFDADMALMESAEGESAAAGERFQYGAARKSEVRMRQLRDSESATPAPPAAPPATRDPASRVAPQRAGQRQTWGTDERDQQPRSAPTPSSGGYPATPSGAGMGGGMGGGGGLGAQQPDAKSPFGDRPSAGSAGGDRSGDQGRTGGRYAGGVPRGGAADSYGSGQAGAGYGDDSGGMGMQNGRAAVPGAAPALQSESGGQVGSQDQFGRYWALQGLRGLTIQIDRSGKKLTFKSLGADPVLDITVMHQSRMIWFAWAVALAIIVSGLLMTRASFRARIRWVVLTALLACGLPLIGGPMTEFAVVFEKALLASLMLIPLWVIVAFLSMLFRWIGRMTGAGGTAAAAASLLALLTLVGTPSSALAQDLTEILRPLLEEGKPVSIPDDALVIPYEPDDPNGRERATKVLVPYGRYVKLWNAAHPDKRIGDQQKRHPFSFAGAAYDVVLADEDHIILKGTLDIELFGDASVDVPLALRDGVITAATLDGQPARLKAIQLAPADAAQRPAQNAARNVPPSPSQSPQQRRGGRDAEMPTSLIALVVEGEGRHRLELSIRVAVNRQGGWRLSNATIPYAEATSMRITVPQTGTNVRRMVGKTIVSETTQQDAQVIESTLVAGGTFDITWRARITPGSVDQALTTNSTALVDLREDGVRVAWRIEFVFGQTERGTFRLEVPPDYLVEKVDGKNVRGWDLVKESEKTLLNVELLKAVKQREQFTVHLSRRVALASSQETAMAVPVVAVPDAALHRGFIQIRRSPILELKTEDTDGVSRTDSSQFAAQLKTLVGTSQSPLGVRDYQAYRFKATPFRIALSAVQIRSRLRADLRTLVRIGETESALESEILITAKLRAVYGVRIRIPADLELERVAAAGLSDWSIVPNDGHQVLTTFFSTGQTGRFPISIHGKLADHDADDAVPLPKVAVLDVDQQQGTVVVQVDPSLDARLADLQQCRSVLLDRAMSWLSAAQRPLARLALEYSDVAYSGNVQLSPRTARVTCDTVTNVRVTYREIQETILLDFRITEAGIRQVAFRLPARLADAHVSAPMIRQKTVAPSENENTVTVTLDLQDAINGQYRVVIENDRAIRPGVQTAPLPLVDTGTTNNRYVTLENAGRDEIIVVDTPGMESVNRQSRQWQQLSTRLQGGDFTTAFVTADTGPSTSFSFQTKQRQMVKTAGATIGLAETLLVLDGSGAFRASMLLRIDNRTEPYLEIQLPENTELWTAHVADRPVKPAHTAGSQSDGILRIPLIKTAEGDLDYPVVLKYAGKLDHLNSFQSVSFPIIRTVNINAERSQVRLFLPQDFKWYQFDGSATRVYDEGDLEADYVAYQTEQVENLTQIIRGSNEFSKLRAIYNVEKLGEELKKRERGKRRSDSNEQLRQNLFSNKRALETATQEIQTLQKQVQEFTDNRDRLNYFYEEQRNTLSRNSVTRLGVNFPTPAQKAAAGKPTQPPAQQFDQNWFSRKSAEGKTADEKKPGPAKGKAPPAARLRGEQSQRAQQQADMPAAQNAAQNVFQVQPADQSGAQVDAAARGYRSRALGTKEALNEAYFDKIERQVVDESLKLAAPAEGVTASTSDRSSEPAAEEAQTVTGLATVAGRIGLSSLDFDLPTRGTVYYFTKPRGDVEITARPVENQLVQRLVNFGWLLAIVLVLAIAAAVIRRLARSRRGLFVSTVLLCLVGVALLVVGRTPIFGFVMLMGAVLLVVEIRTQSTATEPS